MAEASNPVRMLCIYRIKEGKENEFESLLERHWPTLRSVGLASEKPARWYRGGAKDGRSRFVELFEWQDAQSSGIAHQSPEVLSVWEPMGALAESMEFIELETSISALEPHPQGSRSGTRSARPALGLKTPIA